jgi:hypothetical protein
MRKIIVTEELVSDVDGKEIPDEAGWAIIRLRDRLEVAHINNLDELRHNGGLLAEVAFSASKQHDKEAERAALS